MCARANHGAGSSELNRHFSRNLSDIAFGSAVNLQSRSLLDFAVLSGRSHRLNNFRNTHRRFAYHHGRFTPDSVIECTVQSVLG